MNSKTTFFLRIFSLIFLNQTIFANSYQTKNSEDPIPFEVYSQDHKASILYDKNSVSLDSIVAHQLAEDIFRVTHYKPEIITNLKQAKGHVIVIGSLDSKLVAKFLNIKDLNTTFKNQWESYLYKTILNPNRKIKKALIVAGTDPRGTAYGVFNISKEIGVNPWYWWADVPVTKQEQLVLNQEDFHSKPPSVKYRGIFLNDEDWGLQPWAAKTYEPNTGDIGPKTYAKIFELLLRLNANTIWPAMHPSTKAFFHYPGNAEMATLYEMVIGTSHAEPMLRNNVDEWNQKELGAFNYKTNKTTVLNYWEERVKEAKNIDAIYTMGMRGVHDSGMEGVKNKEEAIELLDGIISDQRHLFKKHIQPNVETIPQALTVYKEVLDLYKHGLNVPEDITLVWSDDNYGYIRALGNAAEQKRAGGSGVYYHVSYWGRPHDYLWLSTAHPGLIREEMMKAYHLNTRNIWILNVGDIKPAEYEIQLFLDMAYDAEAFQNPSSTLTHQQEFFGAIFGNTYAQDITKIKTSYFDLAFERKPEFMGWSQTEPTTPTFNTAYNALLNGDEIQKRVQAYDDLERQVTTIEARLPEKFKSTFVQLVSYPVQGASLMNKKFLYKDKALAYNKQGRKSAHHYAQLSHKAYEDIEALTFKYNQISNGKWEHMMDMKPRRLPVFDKPVIEILETTTEGHIGLSVEDTLKTDNGTWRLPTFYVGEPSAYFIDVFLKNNRTITWNINALPSWINVSKASGVLEAPEVLEDRIYVSIDWNLWKAAGKPTSSLLNFQIDAEEKPVQITISKSYEQIAENSFIEKNGQSVIYANHYTKNKDNHSFKWTEISGLGHSKSVMQSEPYTSSALLNHESAPVLEYELFTETVTKQAILSLVAIPTHPLTTDGDLRVAVQWNDEPIQHISFKTEGRSTTWKENVLSNKAIKHLQVPIHKTGKQILKIYMVDAGVLLDYIVLNARNAAWSYQLLPETKLK